MIDCALLRNVTWPTGDDASTNATSSSVSSRHTVAGDGEGEDDATMSDLTAPDT